MTFGDYIADLSAQGKAKGQDFAYAVRWQLVPVSKENTPLEADVRWLNAGGHMTEWPERTTDQMRALGQHWDEAWTFVRCAEQPVRKTISLQPGKFLPAMPNIEIER